MSKNTSIALGEHFQAFIQQQIRQGQYGSASEVVRAGLRLLEEKHLRLEALRHAIQEGIESGQAEPFDLDDLIHATEGGEHGA